MTDFASMTDFTPMIGPNLVQFMKNSGQAMSALYTDIKSDPQKKAFVVDTLKGVTTAYLAKRNLQSQPNKPPTIPPTITEEKIVLNNHSYSGYKLRHILTSFLVTILVAAGLTGIFMDKSKLKIQVDNFVKKMDIHSVLKLLSSIIIAIVDGLKKFNTSASESFKKLLKKTEVKEYKSTQ